MLSSTPIQTRRRATVLIMVVGVLAMLFIIGSTLLVVSRFERQTVEQKILAVTRSKGNEFNLDSILAQLRLAAVGLDGIPYNQGWHADGVANSGDVFVGEKYATFPGWYGTPNASNVAAMQARLRSGNSLLASNEPYLNGSQWTYFATSWSQLFAEAGAPNNPFPRNAVIDLTKIGNPDGDADAEGVPDARKLADTSFDTYLRITSNGGKVLFDRFTHPSLLMQVIHPRDWAALSTAPFPTISDLQNDIIKMLIVPSEDESRLSRRWLLPGNVDLTKLPNGDMRLLLPFTLGFDGNIPYTAASGWSPHWQQVSLTRQVPQTSPNRTDPQWWTDHVLPGTAALTDSAGGGTTAYDPMSDVYDRRHLITTVSNDDILRPSRDEKRLKKFTDGAATGPTTFGDLIAPTRGMNAAMLPLAYGAIPQPTATPPVQWSVLFNTDLAHTQFSLRDVLGDWYRDATNNVVLNGSGNPTPVGVVSYRRVAQLTAYYLAMIQHTSFPGANATLDPAATADQTPLQQQLEAAAQLAVNTIDFADAGTLSTALTPWITVLPGLPAQLDDPPTRFRWSDAAGTVKVDVVGVERHPYITEAYARIVQVHDLAASTKWGDAPDPLTSIYAVELYNPYDVALDLSHYTIGTSVTITTSGGTQVSIPPFSYIIVTNRFDIAAPWFSSAVAPPQLDVNVFVNAALEIKNGTPITLVRQDVLEVTPTGLTYGKVTDRPIVVDSLEPQKGTADPIATWANAAAFAQMGKPPETLDVTQKKYLYHDEDPARPYPVGTCPVADGVVGSAAPYYVRRPGEEVDGTPLAGGITAANDQLVRDYSLQRHKEYPGRPPLFWHATLARQMMFPSSAEYESTAAPPCVSNVPNTSAPAVHHNLFWSGYDPNPAPPATAGWQPTGSNAQSIVDSEFKGFGISSNSVVSGTTPVIPPKDSIAGFPVILGRALPETPRPIVLPYNQTWSFDFKPVSHVQLIFDASLPTPPPVITDLQGQPPTAADLTAGTVEFGQAGGPPIFSGIRMSYKPTAASSGFKVTRIIDLDTNQPVEPLAFPTTGSLLLVTRFANTAARPASVAAAETGASLEPGIDKAVEKSFANTPGALQRLDNGHMPLWDDTQKCTDNDDLQTSADPTLKPTDKLPPQSALNVPWGQLIYNYFTALPVEELFFQRNLSSFTFSANTRLVDLDNNQYVVAYSYLFPGVPEVVPLAGPTGPLVGPSVRGRININTAPPWVLDGLPLLPWDATQTETISLVPVPATEIVPVWNDPSGTYANYDRADGSPPAAFTRLPGLMLATETADENKSVQDTLNLSYAWSSRHGAPPLELPSVSPSFAKALVAYREIRPAGLAAAFPLSQAVSQPGFLSVGQIADVLRRINITFDLQNAGGYTSTTLPPVTLLPMLGIREQSYTLGGTIKPYVYLNYLQLVAPLVRLQDWATVKDHVFTIYMTQGDMTVDPPVWTHSEVTVDTTRCLYTNDLPAIVAQTPAVSYYNVVSDSK